MHTLDRGGLGERESETLLHISPSLFHYAFSCRSSFSAFFFSVRFSPSLRCSCSLTTTCASRKTELISEHHRDSVNVMFYILLAVLTQKNSAELMMSLIKLSCANSDAIPVQRLFFGPRSAETFRVCRLFRHVHFPSLFINMSIKSLIKAKSGRDEMKSFFFRFSVCLCKSRSSLSISFNIHRKFSATRKTQRLGRLRRQKCPETRTQMLLSFNLSRSVVERTHREPNFSRRTRTILYCD